MKKVILAAAALAAFSFGAKAENTSDSTIVNVNVTAVDMIQLTPNGPLTRSYTTPSSFNNWDQIHDLGNSITWTINATRGYKLSVSVQDPNGFAHVGPVVAGVNYYLRPGRLGVDISGATAGTAGVALGSLTNVAPSTNSTGYPGVGEGLTTDKKMLGFTNIHGVIGGQVTTQLKIFPSVFDGLSGEYQGNVVFTAELNDDIL